MAFAMASQASIAQTAAFRRGSRRTHARVSTKVRRAPPRAAPAPFGEALFSFSASRR